MSTPNKSWMKVRIKTKYAEMIREYARLRDESEIDALYYILDTFRQSQRGNIINQTIKPVENEPIKSEPVSIDDMDFSTFE